MTETSRPRRRSLSALALPAVTAAASAALLLLATTDDGPNYGRRSPPSSLGRRRELAAALARFADPKSVSPRAGAPLLAPASDDDLAAVEDLAVANANPAGAANPVVRDPAVASGANPHFAPVDMNSRSRCQIVYLVGVEGATHHGVIPILENLAKHQVDENGEAYVVDASPESLKAGLFGWFYHKKIKRWGFKVTPEVDDPEFVRKVVQDSCPPGDGRKHVLIEWASFPSGHEDDPRTYRVHRAHEWLAMSPEEVANSEEALSHPTSMNAFYQAYSPYVDIKFIVLHRPFLETIASHRDWDGGPETHSNIIRGFMLMLRRFLDTHLFDLVTGSRLWSLVCVERIMAKNYNGDEAAVAAARHNVLNGLARFLGWPDGDCPRCFDDWHESTKDPIEVLGEENVPVLREHMKWLEGVWPPPGEEGVAEQRCGI